MNHEYIEQNTVIDLYVAGRLGPDDVAAFEEHYLSCDDCLLQLEAAEGFRAGMKRVAAEDAIKAAVGAGLLARLLRSPRAGLLAAAALVAVLLPSGLLVRQLGQERDRAAALGEELAAERSPQEAVYLPLSPERGGGAPSARVRLPGAPGWIVLSLELERPEAESYRVVLVDPGGTEVWRGEGFAPNHLDALTVSLHSSTLSGGDYELRIEAPTADGEPIPAGRFAFRALAAN